MFNNFPNAENESEPLTPRELTLEMVRNILAVADYISFEQKILSASPTSTGLWYRQNGIGGGVISYYYDPSSNHGFSCVAFYQNPEEIKGDSHSVPAKKWNPLLGVNFNGLGWELFERSLPGDESLGTQVSSEISSSSKFKRLISIHGTNLLGLKNGEWAETVDESEEDDFFVLKRLIDIRDLPNIDNIIFELSVNEDLSTLNWMVWLIMKDKSDKRILLDDINAFEEIQLLYHLLVAIVDSYGDLNILMHVGIDRGLSNLQLAEIIINTIRPDADGRVTGPQTDSIDNIFSPWERMFNLKNRKN